MNVFLEHMKIAVTESDLGRTSLVSGAVSYIRDIVGTSAERRHDRQIRNSYRGLERLDDSLLKDVGLQREHLPSGAIRVVRR